MSQKTLFDAEPPEWEVDAQSRVLAATVVFPKGAPGEYDYAVPDGMADERQQETFAEPGRRVRVPMGRGNRQVIGYCVAIGIKSSARPLKPLTAVIDAGSLLSPAMLRLTRWMADHYLTPWGQVLEAVVPSGVRGKAGTRDVTLLSVPTKVGAKLTQLKLTEKQKKVLETLLASGKPLTTKQLAMRSGCTTGPIGTLRKRGLIEAHVERLDSDANDRFGNLEAPERLLPKKLNPDQQKTLDVLLETINSGKHETILVHGVTSSGKTEVYIQAIERVVSFGRQAIVLVPEISLTPQTVGRFRERFDKVAVLHSHLSDVERHRQWRRIASGDVQVVIGARSAIFAPTPQLGLVVIDEEHETSFKQDSAPRYHARDVALFRTKEEAVPLVLASATPALESWCRTQPDTPADRRYVLSVMPRRIGNLPMPGVKTIDMRIESKNKWTGALSRQLCQAMQQALRDDGQVILLLNRRGFSTHLQCPGCGFVQKCEHCDVAMTFHRTDSTVICHWCDYRMPPPQSCPDCKSPKIRYGGLGTQKLEAEVRARFPRSPLVRMDADTMRRPGSHETALDAFRKGETRILLGTQMIAKGLDFPNVTLVGVISADSALHLPDFRASERTFHLVTQVAGRTGRSERGGRVLVQTFDPDHPAIQAAVRHDYAMFAQGELPTRKAFGYPPYGSFARVVAKGQVANLVEVYLEAVTENIRAAAKKANAPIRLLGPAIAPIARLRGDHRYHLQLQSPDDEALRNAIRDGWQATTLPDGVRSIVDIDPVDMM